MVVLDVNRLSYCAANASFIVIFVHSLLPFLICINFFPSCTYKHVQSRDCLEQRAMCANTLASERSTLDYSFPNAIINSFGPLSDFYFFHR